ncbi:MAG: hypothetical protein RLZZ504_1827 [Bacteroidota bacterium]|jgi:putative membrane protein
MNNVENRFITLIAIIYCVGIAGFIIPSLNPTFIWLTPYNIIAAFIFAWIFHKKWEAKHVALIITVGVLGFFLEYAGVTTGKIFGSYHYGKTLGRGWQGVPYLIGLNWAALVFFTSSLLAGRFSNPYGASFLGASLMTLYDFFLEPVAMRYDFWHWHRGIVPVQNYIAWFIAAFLFQLLLHLNTKPQRNKMAGAMYLIQLGFFLILYVWIRIF